MVEGQRAQGRQPGQDQCPADRSASDGHIWAERYDRDLTDIFAVQDEITKTIVEQLKVKLLPEEKKAIEQAPTDNVEAYTNYLRGRQFFVTGTKSSFDAGPAHVRQGGRTGSALCPCICRHGELRFAALYPARASRSRSMKSW